ncbi:hypothetical protein AXK57_22020 [Tsukamurella pulmonis]|uniref:hypothetical protein n=1 Tax=Tsukamurella pulmonis TaxID=47312 RepID=UPI000793FBAA|nr:hypothetical protein [Tsukamurella pulmonis]KXP11553.1 hypothetical protein AXK57_22020 [Tsukamurella pulmonis]
MARNRILSKAAAAAAVIAVLAAPAASADPVKVPEIPNEYRAGLVDAGKVCKQVDSPLVAAVLAHETEFQADKVSPAGMVSAGQVPPKVWEQYARDGEKPTDPTSSSLVTARHLCAIASEVDKAAPTVDTPDVKTIMTLVVFNAGDSMLPHLVDGGSASAKPHVAAGSTTPAEDAATAGTIRRSTDYAQAVLELRDAYRTQGI